MTGGFEEGFTADAPEATPRFPVWAFYGNLEASPATIENSRVQLLFSEHRYTFRSQTPPAKRVA